MGKRAKPSDAMLPTMEDAAAAVPGARKRTRPEDAEGGPKNVGKPIKVAVPDFSDPNRPKTCLEVDFPVAPINALSALEGNASKPIYQMSKWWARRRSSIFRAMLIAAGTEAPRRPDGTVDELAAARLVWDLYYANHQKAGSFKNLKVLDIFMGGGTTLVEGSRLGCQVAGVDLNPVAWFVVKNELARTDPEQVKRFFDYIQALVNPLIQPFYVTECPRGHKGKWYRISGDGSDCRSAKREAMPAGFDPCTLPPDERHHYAYEGPEIIYTFWSKHGPCPADGCGHRTPVFPTPVIATKTIGIKAHKVQCHHCKKGFDWDLADPRMAPAEPLVISPDEPAYVCPEVEEDKADCPHCGKPVRRPTGKPISKKVDLTLLIHPDWLKGSPGTDEHGPLGGAVDRSSQENARWFRLRLKKLSFVEVRGPSTDGVPDPKHSGRTISSKTGTVPGRAEFSCGACGRKHDRLTATRSTAKLAPAAIYALQGYCPACDAKGHPYNGRFFKVPGAADIERLVRADLEWAERRDADLAQFWPRNEIPFSMAAHVEHPLPGHGFTHYWKMFNARQLLIHSQLLRSIMEAPGEDWSDEVKEQAFGALQQYLRNQNMFCFWNVTADKLEPFLSNPNYHVKVQVIENNYAHSLGRGNWESCAEGIVEALEWVRAPWELGVNTDGRGAKSTKYGLADCLPETRASIICASSTELTGHASNSIDLIITDPPFNNRIYYADLGDFFYVWLRIPLKRIYRGKPEEAYFVADRAPHAVEAQHNPAEYPDDREVWERDRRVTPRIAQKIRELTGDASIKEGQCNPLYREEPASAACRQIFTDCWVEANRIMKHGGLLAFTFHHNEDEAWVEVLESLFDAGFILLDAYPVRSDETKGENAAFGSQKIEYDIIHVCRKRLEEPIPVSWAKMRRWVKDEMVRLRNLLELYRRDALPEADIRVILRGKALEFYSRHYGQVFKGTEEPLTVREALLGINQLLDDDQMPQRKRPPEDAEPLTRLLLQVYCERSEIARDELHKLLRGTGVTLKDFEDREWVREHAKVVYQIPIPERFEQLRKPGRRRDTIKIDLDQAHFLTGAAVGGSGINIMDELNKGAMKLKPAVLPVLNWLAEMELDGDLRKAARRAAELVERWRAEQAAKPKERTLFDLDE